MTLLIHIVGRSDLGIDQVRNIADGAEARGGALAQLEPQRLEELKHCSSSDIVSHLLDGLYSHDTVAAEARLGLKVECLHGTPLRGELDTLANASVVPGEPAGTSGAEPRVVRLLLVGSDVEPHATSPLARALHEALSHSVEPIERCTGIRIEMTAPCIVPSLDPDQATEAFELALEQEAGPIVLSGVGGATALLASCAGVLAAGRSDEWSLLVGYPGKSETFSPVAVAAPKSLENDSLRGWLLGLGLPTLLAPDVSDPGVEDAAKAIGRAAGKEPGTPPTSADLGLLLMCDVARGDLAAGMALRSWIKAEYLRQRCAAAPSESPCPDEKTRKELKGQLGRLFRRVAQNGGSEPYDSWLLRQRGLNELGKRATHDFAGGWNDGTDKLRSAVLAALEGVHIRRPDWLSWPGPDICLIIGGHNQKGRRPHPIAQYLRALPDESLRQACATAQDLRAHIIMLASDDTKDAAQSYAKDPESHRHVRGWADPEITVTAYGPAMLRDRDRSVEAMTSLTGTLLAQLDSMETPPRAVAVYVAGERFAVLAALRAAQEYGARHGIPVFLHSSVTGPDKREVMGAHQLGLDQDVRRTILRAAIHCLDRMDLFTTKRLLLIGDREMRNHADALDSLSGRFSAAVVCRDVDAHASTILAVLKVVADSWDRNPESDLRARLMTIVGELLAPKSRSVDPGPPRILATDRGQRLGNYDAADASKLLRVLVTARNKTTFTHGDNSAEEALEEAFAGLRMTGWDGVTYQDLLRKAIQAVEKEHGATPGDWAVQFHELRQALDRLRGRLAGPPAQPASTTSMTPMP